MAVGDINDAGGEETIGLIEKTGGMAMFVHTDVSVMDDCQRLVSSAVERFGGLHILHNDAFWSDHNHTVVELSESSWDRTLDVSLKAMFLMSKFAIPEILRSGGGSIVNMASAVALMGSRGNPAYAAAKGGVIALTKAMAIDYGKKGIRVNCIAPGAVATPANAHLRRDPDYHKRSMSRMLLSRLTRAGRYRQCGVVPRVGRVGTGDGDHPRG